MIHSKIRSIRPFLGARDFNVSRSFYRDLGFDETVIAPNLSVFKKQGFSFYFQDAYVEDWVDNTMVFLEVEDTQSFWNDLQALNLPGRYSGVRIQPIRKMDWGSECFIHDPSGILWHCGSFQS